MLIPSLLLPPRQAIQPALLERAGSFHRATAPARGLFLLSVLCWVSTALASEPCQAPATPRSASTLNLRMDNDLLGGTGQDQGYSNGILATLVSPNLADQANSTCLPGVARWLSQQFAERQSSTIDEWHLTAGFGHLMFTPTERKRRGLIASDRPYAGALMFSLGYSARTGDVLRTSQLRVGVVGPSAKAGEVQNALHRVIGADSSLGWDNQLHDEPVIQLIHERRERLRSSSSSQAWQWDAIGAVGGSIGNFATAAHAGMELRLGTELSDDFGMAPLRPAGENTTAFRTLADGMWRSHLFLSLDARWVMRDITLDGNTFRNSHSVDKRPFVADIGYGIAADRGRWRIAFARYHRTREFAGQRQRPVFGSVTFTRGF